MKMKSISVKAATPSHRGDVHTVKKKSKNSDGEKKAFLFHEMFPRRRYLTVANDGTNIVHLFT